MSAQINIDDVKFDEERLKARAADLMPAKDVDKFVRVVMTALVKNPELLAPDVDKRSLYVACMDAAQDGLMLDGEEAALSSYWDKDIRKRMVQYMPMIGGLRKKALESGLVLKWDIRLVYSKDQFDRELGDPAREFIYHKPAVAKDRKERGEIVAAYSIVTLKNGTVSREWMDLWELEDIRERSQNAKKAIWVKNLGEMYRKTIGHRHYKVLPHSPGMDRFMSRFEDQFGLDKDEIDEPITKPTDNIPPKEEPPQDEPKGTTIDGNTGKPVSTEIATTSGAAPEPKEIQLMLEHATNKDDLLAGLSCINDIKAPVAVKKELMETYRKQLKQIEGA